MLQQHHDDLSLAVGRLCGFLGLEVLFPLGASSIEELLGYQLAVEWLRYPVLHRPGSFSVAIVFASSRHRSLPQPKAAAGVNPVS